jgi:Fur family iron response transcriptional regulator
MVNQNTTWPENRDEVSEMLVAHDIQPTQQRVEIAQILFARPQHLSAEQVLKSVNQGGAAVSKATVYNTLGIFAEKGLVRQVIVDPSRVFYDSNTGEHHHIYNIDTGTLTDISTDEININHLPSIPDDMVTEGVDVIVRVRSKK